MCNVIQCRVVNQAHHLLATLRIYVGVSRAISDAANSLEETTMGFDGLHDDSERSIEKDGLLWKPQEAPWLWTRCLKLAEIALEIM